MMSGFTFKKSVFGFLDMLKFKQIGVSGLAISISSM